METIGKVPYIICQTVRDMLSRKIFLTAIAISLAGHIAVVALSGLINGGFPAGEDVFSVSLENHPEKLEKIPAGDKDATHGAEEQQHISKFNEIKVVDTIDLDSTDTRYYPYLLKVKKSIDGKWSYPDDAFNRGEGGTTVVEFSIVKEGMLAGSRIITSSGYGLLDAESLHAIRSAAPFSPFPSELGLSKLNIVAKFRYKIEE